MCPLINDEAAANEENFRIEWTSPSYARRICRRKTNESLISLLF